MQLHNTAICVCKIQPPSVWLYCSLFLHHVVYEKLQEATDFEGLSISFNFECYLSVGFYHQQHCTKTVVIVKSDHES